MAESSLEKQIDALQDEITNGQIEFKKRPGTQSKTLNLKRKKRIETRKVMREQAGLIEAKRLQDTKVRVQKQIDELKRKVQNKDFSKKSSKTLIEDTELTKLRGEN
jgi:hypothetical protein